MTLRHVVRRISDDAAVAEAEMVFVCIDRLGRATPIPDEIARFLGPRPSGGHPPIQVPAGDVELAVDVRGEGVPVLFVHGFPFDRTMWRTSSPRCLVFGASRRISAGWATRGATSRRRVLANALRR